MVHRLALIAGAFAATTILFLAAGTASVPSPTEPPADVLAEPAAALSTVPVAVPPVVRTVTDTVYVAPVPEPAIVHITRPAPPVTFTPAPAPTRLKPRPTDREREHEDGDLAEGEDD